MLRHIGPICACIYITRLACVRARMYVCVYMYIFYSIPKKNRNVFYSNLVFGSLLIIISLISLWENSRGTLLKISLGFFHFFTPNDGLKWGNCELHKQSSCHLVNLTLVRSKWVRSQTMPRRVDNLCSLRPFGCCIIRQKIYENVICDLRLTLDGWNDDQTDRRWALFSVVQLANWAVNDITEIWQISARSDCQV